MRQWPIQHFTADDLDAFHSASLSVEAREHLEECAECRALVEQDRALIHELSRLPSFQPAPGFADRVLAQMEPRKAPIRIARPRRVALAASLGLALAASMIWSLLNRDLLLNWLNHSAAALGSSLWDGLRVAASNLTEQPWFESLRQFGSSTARVALVGGGLFVGYGAAVLALRRLLVPSSRPVPHANW